VDNELSPSLAPFPSLLDHPLSQFHSNERPCDTNILVFLLGGLHVTPQGSPCPTSRTPLAVLFRPPKPIRCLRYDLHRDLLPDDGPPHHLLTHDSLHDFFGSGDRGSRAFLIPFWSGVLFVGKNSKRSFRLGIGYSFLF